MIDKAVSDLWWNNAVVYCLDVETFMDADGDGIGDFRGLTRRVDHLAGLGVTCVWLMPFYPTPNRDDGYDITDFYTVDPRLGTLGDFVEFMRTARERGLRVIVDLVVNHTSRQHPWFRSARSSRDSPYRDWYVWADEPLDEPSKIIFPSAEDSNWAYDEEAGQYYLHRFYSEQPDLNVGNADVRDEIHRIMGFWLELGVSGFRVDAVPYLIEGTGIEGDMADDPHRYLREMRAFMSRRRGDAIMVGEVNLRPERQRRFFGDETGDELQLLFNFYGCGKLFLALARQDAAPLADALRTLPAPPPGCQWANFVRNHDELNLSRLPQGEQDEILDAFAPDETMRMFGRGARRRLPPMLDRDERRVRLAYSLLLTLPGTPTLLYGEEIGMGEDLSVDGRMSIRTPMQWSAGRNAGFSPARPGELIRPVTGGDGGSEGTNVADQRQDPDSLLNWMERAVRARRQAPEFGWGGWRVVDVDAEGGGRGAGGADGGGAGALFVHRCDGLGGTVLAAHNLAAQPCRVRLRPSDLAGDGGTGDGAEVVADLFGDRRYPPVDPADPVLEVDGHGYRWLRVVRDDARARGL